VGASGFRTAAGETAPRPADAIFNGCWRREVFDRVGLFNEQLQRSQDIEFSARIRAAGGRLVLLPAIESRYYISGELLPFWRQSWTNGVWALLPARYLGRLPVGLRHLAPLAFVLTLVAAGVAAMAAPGWAWLPEAVVAAYLAANLAASIEVAWKERNPALAVLAPVAFASLHLAYGAGSLWGALRVAAAARPRKPAGRTVAASEGNLP
jgi:hypothetical protein